MTSKGRFEVKPTLLILAAGMGNRYGGLKQIDPVGPSGEIIIDYSIYDAISAGFGKLVFVIRHYFEDAFKKKIGSKFDGIVETAYAYQELDACLDGFELPPNRQKPWGTGHAILVAKDLINEAFAVINADDFYGAGSFKVIADYLSTNVTSQTEYCMVGYTLRNTLSEYGCVSRGVCSCDDQMFLKEVIERTKVEKKDDGVEYINDMGQRQQLCGDEIVSLNLWGFQPSIFGYLQAQFSDFLNKHGREPEPEFFIPTAVDNLIKSGQARVKVLPTDDCWFGVTYRQDKKIAVACINELIKQGVYPERLWQK